jgi:hypothetical protein
MTTNVNYAIKSSQINDLHGGIQKATKMEEYMIETNVDLEIILGKVQRQMFGFSISPQGPSTSRSSKNRGIGGGILQGFPPNVRNNLGATQETRQNIEMDQMRRTIRQM